MGLYKMSINIDPSSSLSTPVSSQNLQEEVMSAPSIQESTQKGLKKFKLSHEIVQDYCQAFIEFSLSKMALAYLQNLLETEPLSLEEFVQIVRLHKGEVKSLKVLKRYLIEKERDSAQMRAWKRVFRGICQVFLNNFCVNWIFKLDAGNKMKYLRFRRKMLKIILRLQPH